MSRRGFTLVELLVVIAVIGILTGIVVPGVGMIQRESRNVGCLSNLRQNYIAVGSYRESNGGRIPMCEFLPVVTDAGDAIGTVLAIENFGATDIIEIALDPVPEKGPKTFMVPIIPAAVIAWDDKKLVISADFADN